jgi:hypothetical protein
MRRGVHMVRDSMPRAVPMPRTALGGEAAAAVMEEDFSVVT